MYGLEGSPLGILAAALLIDQLWGEFPSRLHPVVWIGKLVSISFHFAPRIGFWNQFIWGLVATISITSISTALAAFALWVSSAMPLLQLAVGAYLLKSSFALRELGDAADVVSRHLQQGNVENARAALRALCSRDPSDLDEQELLGAAISSIAENASDSFVAPLFYFVFFGVPGAVAYRAINTLDSMVGYHGRWDALGKVSARLDDFVNWMPARLTALLLLLAGACSGLNAKCGWRILWRDAGVTPSPNGGWPMSAMAGLLGIALEKQGFYVLGDPREPIATGHVQLARRVLNLAALFMVIGSVLVIHSGPDFIRALLQPDQSLPAEVRAPRRPVKLLPAMAHSRNVVVDHVDMNQLNPAAILVRQKRQDQGRIEVRRPPMGRAPRLDDETLWSDLEDGTREYIVEGTKGRAWLSGDRHRRASEGGVLDGIEIHVK